MGKVFTPEQQSWQWYEDTAADPTVQYANVDTTANVADNEGPIRLRVDITELGQASGTPELTILYQLDGIGGAWTAMGAGNHWNWANGAGTHGGTVGTVLLSGTTAGQYWETEDTTTVSIGKNVNSENDFCIAPVTANVSTTGTYYFAIYADAALIPILTSHPTLTVTATSSSSSSVSSSSSSQSSSSLSSQSSSSVSSSSSSESSSSSSSVSSSSSSSESSSSSSSESSSSSSSESSSSSAWVFVSPGGVAFGEESPTEGETPSPWLEWSDGSGGTPGTDNWGTMCLNTAEEAWSPVWHHGDGSSQTLTITLGRYAADPSGQGIFTTYIRGQATLFSQDDGSPSWELYTAPTDKTWEYTQVRLVGV